MTGGVLTIGTFDLAHVGHFNLLQRARLLSFGAGQDLTVGVNTDTFAKSFKRPPVQTYAERVETLRVLGYRTAANDGPGFELIHFVKPQVLVVGTDWARKDYYTQIGMAQDELDELGIILAYVPYTHGVSTTDLIERIRAGE